MGWGSKETACSGSRPALPRVSTFAAVTREGKRQKGLLGHSRIRPDCRVFAEVHRENQRIPRIWSRHLRSRPVASSDYIHPTVNKSSARSTLKRVFGRGFRVFNTVYLRSSRRTRSGAPQRPLDGEAVGMMVASGERSRRLKLGGFIARESDKQRACGQWIRSS